MWPELQQHVLEVLRDALTITVFVFVMMVVVEYVNVLTRGAWQRRLMLSRWRQYVLSGLLGIVPGDPLGRRFRDLSGMANQKMAEAADKVILMVSGIPLFLKGAA